MSGIEEFQKFEDRTFAEIAELEKLAYMTGRAAALYKEATAFYTQIIDRMTEEYSETHKVRPPTWRERISLVFNRRLAWIKQQRKKLDEQDWDRCLNLFSASARALVDAFQIVGLPYDSLTVLFAEGRKSTEQVYADFISLKEAIEILHDLIKTQMERLKRSLSPEKMNILEERIRKTEEAASKANAEIVGQMTVSAAAKRANVDSGTISRAADDEKLASNGKRGVDRRILVDGVNGLTKWIADRNRRKGESVIPENAIGNSGGPRLNWKCKSCGQFGNPDEPCKTKSCGKSDWEPVPLKR